MKEGNRKPKQNGQSAHRALISKKPSFMEKSGLLEPTLQYQGSNDHLIQQLKDIRLKNNERNDYFSL